MEYSEELLKKRKQLVDLLASCKRGKCAPKSSILKLQLEIKELEKTENYAKLNITSKIIS